MSEKIKLVPVVASDHPVIAGLQVRQDQVSFVASNAASLQEAEEDQEAIPRAIMAGSELVGFLMYSAPQDEDEARLYRFMIDRNHQQHGYGKAALLAFLDEIRGLPHIARVSVCYELENRTARLLYQKAGFIEDGLDEDDEMIAYLTLNNDP